MKKGLIRMAVIIGVVSLLVASLLAACAPAPTPAPTPTPTPTPTPAPPVERTVKIAWVADISGPYGTLTHTHVNLMLFKHYFDWINSKGGIEGVKIDFDYADTGFDKAVGITKYREFREKGVVVIISISTDQTLAILSAIKEDPTPVFLISPCADTMAYIPPSAFFNPTPGYENMFGAALDWLKADWEGKGKAGKPKLGILAYDTAYGRTVLTDRCLGYAEEIGFDYLGHEFVSMTPADTSIQQKKLAEAGADIIFCNLLEGTMIVVLKDADRLGLTKEIQYAGSCYAATPDVIKGVGEATEGFVQVTYYTWWDRKSPGMKFMETVMLPEIGRDRYEKEVMAGIVYNASPFMFASTIVAAIENAVKEFGPDNLTGENIIKGAEMIKDMDKGPYGHPLMTPPVTYGPDIRTGVHAADILQITGGKFVIAPNGKNIPIPDIMHR